jgi:creatinine amidohydrolase
MPVHHWLSMSWPAFDRVRRERTVAVLPVGALEAHGPHLPLGTDVVIADAMARAGAERLADRGFEVVVLPALAVAPAPFAAAFAGTVDTAAAATTLLIAGIAGNVGRHGIRVLAIANAHHDPANVAAIREAAAQAIDECTIVFPDLTRRRWASRLGPEFQSGACHAGRYEGSIVLAEHPGWVDVETMRGLPANPASLVDAIRRGDRSFADAGGPHAYFGWPAAATADEGRQSIETLGAILEESVLEALDANPPLRDHGMAKHDSSQTVHVNPPSRARPRGFSHGVLAPAGWRTLHVAGQTAADDESGIATGDFATQFESALARTLEVVRAAGGDPQHVVRMTIYVTDLDEYRAARSSLADVWRRHLGSHYPAMALIGVTGLVDRNAVVEIEADAVLPIKEPS